MCLGDELQQKSVEENNAEQDSRPHTQITKMIAARLKKKSER
jgi:hypothetical protein